MSGKYLSLLVHFTWSTQNREPWIEREMREGMYAYIGGIMRKKKAKLLAAGAVLLTGGPSGLCGRVFRGSFSTLG